ncbi:MAG: RICIN domain-containing protein [Lachnospiraceae bacterium]|nr:RICIN domain-containing protein [Lachnospiraceae bacterium]
MTHYIETKAYTAHSRNDAVAWAIAQNGKALDWDHSYGAQCVDFICYYYNYLGVTPVFGNGSDFVSNKLPAGWTRTTDSSKFQPGDVLATTNGQYGHVGILTEVTGSQFIVYDINGSAMGKVAKTVYSKNGFWQCAIKPDFPDRIIGKRLDNGAGRQIPDGDYFIVSGLSSWDCYGMDQWSALDVNGIDVPCPNGTNVQLWKNMVTTDVDAFTVTYLDNGFYKITQKGTNMALEVAGASMYQEANVQMGPYNSSNEAQMWDIEIAPDIDGRGTGWYALRARNNSFVLDIVGGDNVSPDNGRNAQVYTWNGTKNQKWKFIPIDTDIVDEGDYHIVSAIDTSFGLGVAKGSSVNADYPNAVLSNDVVGTDKVYTIVKQGSYYCIQQKSTGNYLDVEGAGTLKNVGFWPREIEDKVAASHIWNIKADGEGAYYIVSRFNGAYLDVLDGKAVNGQNIWLHWCNSMPAQKWNLIKAVQGLSLEQSQIEVEVDDTVTINPVFTPVDAGNKAIKWSSSDDDIAIIDENGTVTGKSIGTAVITAKSVDGGYSAKCTVNVKKASQEIKEYSVTFDMNGKTGVKKVPAVQKVKRGEKAVRPTKVPELYGYKFVDWYQNSENTVLFDFDSVINKDTVIYAGWLQVENPGPEPVVYHSALDPKPEIDEDTTELYLVKGQKFSLDMADGKWISDNKKILSVSKKGAVNAKKTGNASLKRIDDFGKEIQSIEVTICKPVLQAKKLNLEAGGAGTEKGSLALYNCDNIDVFYYSASPDVALVDQEGNVTAVAKGTAKVTAYANGNAYISTVKVKESKAVKERTLHLTVNTSKSVKLPGVKKTVWEYAEGVSEDDKALVELKNAKITAKKAGTVTLVAKGDLGSYTMIVKVDDPTIQSAHLDDEYDIKAGKGKNKYELIIVTGAELDISYVDLEQPVIYKSSKPEVAFINEDGHIEARKPGKAKFTGKVNGKSITITVNVQ